MSNSGCYRRLSGERSDQVDYRRFPSRSSFSPSGLNIVRATRNAVARRVPWILLEPLLNSRSARTVFERTVWAKLQKALAGMLAKSLMISHILRNHL